MSSIYGDLTYVSENVSDDLLKKYKVCQEFTKRGYHSFRREVQKERAAFRHKVAYKFEHGLQVALARIDRHHDVTRFDRYFKHTHSKFLAGMFTAY